MLTCDEFHTALHLCAYVSHTKIYLCIYVSIYLSITVEMECVRILENIRIAGKEEIFAVLIS